jgi:DNA mismatch repair protein MutS2
VIDRLERERERLRAEAAEFASLRKQAEETGRRLEAEREKVRAEESRVVSQARQRMREEIRRAEVELGRITEEMRKDRRIETVRKATSVLREWKEKARAAEEDPVVRALMSRTAPAPPGTSLVPGQRVYVTTLSKEAEVAALSGPEDREVEVAAGGLKVRVPRDQVRVFAAAGIRGERRGEGGGRPAEASPGAIYVQNPGNTLDMRGMYVDDALPEIDSFLDRLSLAQAPHAFLIHGHGTGALKSAVRRHLVKSPYVKRSFSAPREQGGDGVTIVLLA